MVTPNSSSSSYLTPAEALKRLDARTVGDLCSDTGTRVTPAALLADANLQAALDDAAGLLEAAATVGGKYKPTDLAALTGVSQKFLYRLLADLTLGFLYERRPDPNRPVPPQCLRAMEWVDRMGKGDLVFGLQENQDAGRLDSTLNDEQVVEDRDLTPTILRRHFGKRLERYQQRPD